MMKINLESLDDEMDVWSIIMAVHLYFQWLFFLKKFEINFSKSKNRTTKFNFNRQISLIPKLQFCRTFSSKMNKKT